MKHLDKPALLLCLALAGGVWLAACSQGPPSRDATGSITIRFQAQNSGLQGSLRGVSAVDSRVAWVSGTGGSFSRTTDGGEVWLPGKVPGAEELDFRDIEAWSADSALLMSAGPGEASRIYSTGDGGFHWRLVLTNSEPDGFFDGMAFSDSRNGFLYGDAVAGKPFVMRTEDGGASWIRIDPDHLPSIAEGEIGFAASGSGIVTSGDKVWIATGGARARVLYSLDRGNSWQASETPIVSGDPASGIFSLALDGDLLLAAGGSYQNPQQAGDNLAISHEGSTWSPLQADPPLGYKSAIAFLPGSSGLVLLATGTSGSNYSINGGAHWREVETTGYHALDFGATADSGWVAGSEGRVARILVEGPVPLR